MDVDLGAVTTWVLGRLFTALIVFWMYSGGRAIAKDAPTECRWFLNELYKVIGVVAIITLIVWSSYGTHWEGDGEWAMGREGGEQVTDFVPSDKERNEYGLRTLLFLGIPALVGVFAEANTTQRKLTRLRIDIMRSSAKERERSGD